MEKRTHICKDIEMSCKVENRDEGWRLYRGKTKSKIVHVVCPYCGEELELTEEELEVETQLVEADIMESLLLIKEQNYGSRKNISSK